MRPQFKLSKVGEFGISIEGLGCDSGQYLTNDILSKEKYKRTDSVTINILYASNSKGEESYIKHSIRVHEGDCSDVDSFILEKDGLYKIVHIILPTKAWAEAYIDSEGHAIDKIAKIYYYDENKIFLTEDTLNDSVEVTIQDLVDELAGATNTIKRTDKHTFLAAYLQACHFNLIKKALTLLGDSCKNCDTSDYKLATTNRDIVWMFVNAIKYSLELKNLYQAQMYLEKFWRCNTFCESVNINSTDCGCC